MKMENYGRSSHPIAQQIFLPHRLDHRRNLKTVADEEALERQILDPASKAARPLDAISASLMVPARCYFVDA